MFCFTNEVVERGPKQFRFSINGNGFEIDPEPILITKLQNGNGTEDNAASFTPVNFDKIVERIRPVINGEDK